MVLTSNPSSGAVPPKQREVMLDLEYRHVDVFSRTAFQGNGLVVVLDADGLATGLLQELTREVRQFETGFVSGLRLDDRTARLRVFTEDEELGFAGHPVLGAAAVLHTLSGLGGEVVWTIELGGRRLPVLTRSRDGWVDTSMDQGPAQLGPVVPGELADRCRLALGLPAGSGPDGLPVQVVSTGLPYLIVPVRAEGSPPRRSAYRTSRPFSPSAGPSSCTSSIPSRSRAAPGTTPDGSRTSPRAAPPDRPPRT